MKKTLLAVPLLVLALAGCSAVSAAPASTGSSTPTASAPSAPKVAGVGAPVTIKQSGGSSTVTIQAATYGATIPADPLNTTPTAGGFLILDVEWDGTQGSTMVNPLYVTVTDANGRSGSLTLTTPSMLGSTTISAGEKARGNVGFDISNAGPYTVKITDTMLQEAGKFNITATAR
jgi:protein-disulfide isomerase